MTLGEFIERTGFDPTAEEFNKIAEAYYHFDGDAEAFCKDFVENHRDRDYYIARADEIARLKGQILELDKQFRTECDMFHTSYCIITSPMGVSVTLCMALPDATWLA